MQHVDSSQFGQGAGPSHHPPHYAHTEPLQPGGSVSSSLRQWRKKDFAEKSMVPEATMTTAVNPESAHSAHIAPFHPFYPRASDVRFPTQYTEYNSSLSPFKQPSPTAPVKYSEIVETQQSHRVDLAPTLSKTKEKDYIDLRTPPQSHMPQYQEPFMPQSYPDAIKSGYADAALHSYMSKDYAYMSQKAQFQPQYTQPYISPNLQSYGGYQGETNHFLAHLNKINPRMAQSIINDQHLRESQLVYNNMEQSRNFAHQQRLYPSQSRQQPYYPPYNFKATETPRFPYYSNKYLPMEQQHSYASDSGHLNYSPPKISPNYPPNGQVEYAQHYQHRNVDYYPHCKGYVQTGSAMIASPTSEQSRKSSLKQFLENWVDEEMSSSNLPDLVVSSSNNMGETEPDANKTSKPDAAATEPPLYILDTTEIPSENLSNYLHLQQIEKLPDNICGYLGNNKRTALEGPKTPAPAHRNQIKILENKVVQIHIVETPTDDGNDSNPSSDAMQSMPIIADMASQSSEIVDYSKPKPDEFGLCAIRTMDKSKALLADPKAVEDFEDHLPANTIVKGVCNILEAACEKIAQFKRSVAVDAPIPESSAIKIEEPRCEGGATGATGATTSSSEAQAFDPIKGEEYNEQEHRADDVSTASTESTSMKVEHADSAEPQADDHLADQVLDYTTGEVKPPDRNNDWDVSTKYNDGKPDTNHEQELLERDNAELSRTSENIPEDLHISKCSPIDFDPSGFLLEHVDNGTNDFVPIAAISDETHAHALKASPVEEAPPDPESIPTADEKLDVTGTDEQHVADQDEQNVIEKDDKNVIEKVETNDQDHNGEEQIEDVNIESPMDIPNNPNSDELETPPMTETKIEFEETLTDSDQIQRNDTEQLKQTVEPELEHIVIPDIPHLTPTSASMQCDEFNHKSDENLTNPTDLETPISGKKIRRNKREHRNSKRKTKERNKLPDAETQRKKSDLKTYRHRLRGRNEIRNVRKDIDQDIVGVHAEDNIGDDRTKIGCVREDHGDVRRSTGAIHKEIDNVCETMDDVSEENKDVPKDSGDVRKELPEPLVTCEGTKIKLKLVDHRISDHDGNQPIYKVQCMPQPSTAEKQRKSKAQKRDEQKTYESDVTLKLKPVVYLDNIDALLKPKVKPSTQSDCSTTGVKMKRGRPKKKVHFENDIPANNAKRLKNVVPKRENLLSQCARNQTVSPLVVDELPAEEATKSRSDSDNSAHVTKTDSCVKNDLEMYKPESRPIKLEESKHLSNDKESGKSKTSVRDKQKTTANGDKKAPTKKTVQDIDNKSKISNSSMPAKTSPVNIDLENENAEKNEGNTTQTEEIATERAESAQWDDNNNENKSIIDSATNKNVIYQINDPNVILQIADELLEINVSIHNGKKMIFVKTLGNATARSDDVTESIAVEDTSDNEIFVIEPVDEARNAKETSKPIVEYIKEELLDEDALKEEKNIEENYPPDTNEEMIVCNEEIVSSSTEPQIWLNESTDLEDNNPKEPPTPKKQSAHAHQPLVDEKPPLPLPPHLEVATHEEQSKDVGQTFTTNATKEENTPKEKPMRTSRILDLGDKESDFDLASIHAKIDLDFLGFEPPPPAIPPREDVQENNVTSSTCQELDGKSTEWETECCDETKTGHKRRLSLQEYKLKKKNSVEQKTVTCGPPDLTSGLVIPLKPPAQAPRIQSLPETVPLTFVNKPCNRQREPKPTDHPAITPDCFDIMAGQTQSTNQIELRLPLITPHRRQVDARAMDTNDISLVREHTNLMQRFLKQEKLNESELSKVKQIILYKKRLTQKPTTTADVVMEIEPKSMVRRRKKRFRNLHTGREEEEEEEEEVVVADVLAVEGKEVDVDEPEARKPKIDYSVHQSNSLTLVFKRNCTNLSGMQPVVRLERSSRLEQLVQKTS